MTGLPRFGLFAADVVVTAWAAWLLVCAFGLRERGLLEVSVAWCLLVTVVVAASGVVLGATGGLGASGFLATHAVVLLGVALARRRHRIGDREALACAARESRSLVNERSFTSIAILCLGAAVAAMAAIAAWGEPATADALSYHLPRLGQWMQDGRVSILATRDPRMNLISAVPELVMAWLLGGSDTGFRPADLVQVMGGIMALGATIGMARLTGLGRGPSVLAGALLLGMANVVVQFTASQTDLFVAGIFAAAFYLWLSALMRGSASELGGIGAALAIGAKATLLYMAPGALVWVLFLAWRHPLTWPKWRRTLVAAVLGFILFAVPGFARNWQAYGNPEGPKEWVGTLHKGARSPADFLRKLKWNLTCSIAQVFEPQSQPIGLRSAGRAVVEELEKHVPAHDPYTLLGMSRTERLQDGFVLRTEPDADFTSFGIVTFALFSAGTLAALAMGRRGGAPLVAVWSAGTLTFIVFYHAMQQWHPYAYRYFVLAAPWVALVSAWGIERLRGGWRIAAWAVVLAATADVAWRVTTETYQAGWSAIVRPDQSVTYYASRNWGEWSAALEPRSAPLALYTPEGSALAGFYRRPNGRRISYMPAPARMPATAEEFVRGEPGWVIAPPLMFLGHEGRVAESVWLYNGDPGNMFSVAAFRPLQEGEHPRALLYADVRTDASQGPAHDLLVKTWDAGAVRFTLSNPGARAVAFRLVSLFSSPTGVIPAKGRTELEVVLPADCVSEVKVLFSMPGPRPPDSPEPSVGQ